MININPAGVWKQPTNISVEVAGVWKTVTNAWIEVGGVWKQVYQKIVNFVPTFTAFVADSTNLVFIRFMLDGSVQGDNTETDAYWGKPATPNIGASYWVKFHFSSGTLTGAGGDSLDTWLQLNTSKIRSLTPPTFGYRVSNYIYYISISASDAGILGSGTIRLISTP